LCRQHPGRQNEEILDKVSPQLEERFQMRKFRIGFMCFLATLLVAFVAGCGQETVTLPSVVSVTPAQGSANVAVGTTITATFSQAMSSATITTSTFKVAAQGGTAVTGTVAYSGLVATFTPSAALAYGTTYTATITTGAATPGGAELIGPYVWSFTTVAASVPAVSSVTPLAFAANVPITGAGATISATFTQAMTAASIAATGTFTVEAQGGVVVPGSAVLNSAGTVATFTPTSGTLAYSTTYTVTITTAAKSLSQGIPLAGNYVWTFTTITPPPTVTVVPVNGAIGVPVTQVLTATFSEAMLCSTLTSPATTFTLAAPGSVNVSGTVACAGSVATFTPAVNLAYNTLYSAQISTGAQDLAGQGVALTQWSFLTSPAPDVLPTVISTSPATVATSPYPVVTVGSSISATFSKAMTANTLNSATFLLVTTTGGTSVNGVITYAAGSDTATFAPIGGLAYNTAYTATITTGAEDLAGSGLAANYSWNFTTGNPSTSAPTVTSTNPLNLATGVPQNQVVTATFSEAMNSATIVAANFTLTDTTNSTIVTGLVAYSASSNELVFVPSANLPASSTFNAVITTGVQDMAGQPMAAAYTWSFQTGAAVNTTPPELLSVVPLSGATGVPINQAVSATFNEAMNPLTLTTSTFLLYTGATASGTPVPATITYDSVTFIATLTPTNPLVISTVYTATVTNGVQNVAGIGLGTAGPITNNTWTFTTGTTANQAPVLGPTIASFGGFAGSAGMTNTGLTTVIHGDSGTTATGYSSYTGFHDNTVLIGGVAECTYTETTANVGLVTGTIYSPLVSTSTFCPLEGTAADIAVATEALAEARTAYTTLQGLPSSGGLALEIGTTTIYPGVWTTSGPVNITTGPLYLDAKGDPNAYWVFQIGTILTVGLPATPVDIILKGGAKASNIFWVVAGTGVYLEPSGGGTFEGTIIATNFIHVSTASYVNPVTVNGRLISLNASTTLVDTVINVP
jgi:hypothetical protein